MVRTILQKMYDSEINILIGWMWDGGIEYQIGANFYNNGDGEEVKNTGTDKIEEAIIVIADDVAAKFPNSLFCKWWSSTKARDQDGFNCVVAPVIKWLNDKSHPHAHIIIDSTKAELSEGICAVTTEEYIKG